MSDTDTFQIIGFYDNRRAVSTMSAQTAHEMVKASKEASKKPLPRKSWEDAQALAKILEVTLGRDKVVFQGGYTLEHGKMYEFKNASQAYAVLLTLQSDRLARKTDEQVFSDAQVAKQDLQPVAVAPNHQHFYERTSYMGIGIEVYCGHESKGYALAEPLDRPVDTDYALEYQRIDQALDRDCDRVSNFVMSARYGCGALI